MHHGQGLQLLLEVVNRLADHLSEVEVGEEEEEEHHHDSMAKEAVVEE